MDQPQHRMPVKEFVQQYSQYYLKQCNLDEFRKDLTNVVKVCINLIHKSNVRIIRLIAFAI